MQSKTITTSEGVELTATKPTEEIFQEDFQEKIRESDK